MRPIFAQGRYANVVSTLALVIALGGTGYAASTLPRNSVGSKQLKSNAVTSKKVRNGSLLRMDFKSGQLPAGPKGEKGDTGSKGDPGSAAPRLFAHITDNGALSSVTQGVTAVTNPATGHYAVTFSRDLTGCVALAEVGSVAGVPATFANDTIAKTFIVSGAPRTVTVMLHRASTGATTNGSFNVAAFC